MPRACPVETHVSSYTRLNPTLQMPRACPVECSRSLLLATNVNPPRLKAVASSFVIVVRCSHQREYSTGQARGI
jgi:hypothetical protein